MNLIHLVRAGLNRFDLAIERSRVPDGSSIDVLGLLLRSHPLGSGPGFQVLQIGANDGKEDDPVHSHIIKNSYSAVLVEPIPDVFARLVENYRGVPNIQFVNCAIGKADGTATLYRVRPDDSLPEYTQRLASFDKRIILKQRRTIPDIARHIISVEVPTKTVATLLDESKIRHVHLLVCDTEGFDYQILKMVFEAGVRPDIIHMEVTHIKPTEKALAAQLLSDGGYCYLSLARDLLAVKRSILA